MSVCCANGGTAPQNASTWSATIFLRAASVTWVTDAGMSQTYCGHVLQSHSMQREAMLLLEIGLCATFWNLCASSTRRLTPNTRCVLMPATHCCCARASSLQD